MADTITIRTDSDTEQAREELKRALPRRPMATPDGANLAEDIVRERDSDTR